MWRTTVISALTLLALALAALFEASKLPFGRLSAPQPGFFPVILAVLLAIFSLVLIAQAISGTKEESLRTLVATNRGGCLRDYPAKKRGGCRLLRRPSPRQWFPTYLICPTPAHPPCQS